MRSVHLVLLMVILSHITMGTHVYSIPKPRQGISLEFTDKVYETNYSDPVIFEVRLTDAYGTAIVGVNVSFYLIIGGTDKEYIGYSRTGNDGRAQFRIDDVRYPPGSYRVNASAQYGDDYAEAQADFYVYKEISRIRLLNIPSVEYSDLITIYAALEDDDGHRIPGKELTFCFINESLGPCMNATTDDNGIVCFNISTVDGTYGELGVNTYDFVIIFEGDEYYFGSSCKDILNVTKEEISIMVSTVGKQIVGSSIVIIIKVVDNDNSPVSMAEVRVLINDQVVGAGRTDNNGVYEFTWEPRDSGEHSIKIIVKKENYKDATYEFMLDIEGESGANSQPKLLFFVLGFLFLAVVIAIIARIKS